MSLWIALLALLGVGRAQDFHQLYVGVGAGSVVPIDTFKKAYPRAGLAPRIELSDVVLWGHGQVIAGFSPWSGMGFDPLVADGTSTQYVRSELGFRWHLGPPLNQGRTLVWIGVSALDYTYRITGGPSRSQLRMQHGLGVHHQRGPWLMSLGAGWVPFTGSRYPRARDNVQFFGGQNYQPWPITLTLTVSRSAGTLFETPKPIEGLSPWFALGGGSVWELGRTRDRLMDDDFALKHPPAGWFPQADVGLRKGKHNLLLSFRHLQHTQDSFGLERSWTRESLLLGWEWAPFAVVGLEPFLGLGATGNYLRFVQRDFAVVTASTEAWKIWPVGTVGVGFHPFENEAFRVRSQFRASPGLRVRHDNSLSVSYSQLEWTVLALEVHPRRW